MTKTEVPTSGMSELTSRKQWVCWKMGTVKANGKYDKVPCSPDDPFYSINAQDPRYHLAYADAHWAYHFFFGIDGIGFVPTEADPFCFFDIDSCVDPKTGEYTKPWVPDLIGKLDSLTYVSPSRTGIRIVVKAKLGGKGGDYLWNHSGEGRRFEVYDKGQFLTVTNSVVLARPIKEAQGFVDDLQPLRKQRESKERGSKAAGGDFPEVGLEGDLEQVRKDVKRVLIEHGLHPDPLFESHRKTTLISVGGSLLMRGMPEERLWRFLNEINATLLYNKEGELEGLDQDELKEIHDRILLLEPKVSPPEVQRTLDVLRYYLVSVRPYLKGAFHSDWKLLMGLVPHGRKYGSMSGRRVKIDGSWGTVMGLARIGSRQTFRDKIRRLEGAEVMETGKGVDDASGHFIVDVFGLISNNYFNAPDDFVQKYEYPYQGNVSIDRGYNNHYLGTVSNTSWHRGFGNAKLSLLAALADLGGRAKTSEIAIRMGRVDENGKAASSSISGTIKELCGEELRVLRRVSRGVYEFTDDFAQVVYEARTKSNEYVMDDKYSLYLEDHRRKYEESKEWYRRENRSWLDWYMDYKTEGGSKSIKRWLKDHWIVSELVG